MKISISFYSDKPQNPSSVVMVSASFSKQRLLMSTGISINPKQWSTDKNRLKASAESAVFVNAEFDGIESKLKEIFHFADINKIPITKEYLKSEFKKYRSGIAPETSPSSSIYFHFEEFIRIRTNDVAYGKGILSWYKLALKHLRNFRPDITFGEIDETFYSEFVTYLIKTKDMSNNTVGGHIKALKAFMKWAFDKNLTSNIKFLKFKNLSNDADTVCLNEKELSLLENIDLTVNPKLIDVRNMFLIEIYTGLRVSDLLSLTKENFDMENKIIRINIQKTRETLQIPIHTRLAAILEQYSELKFPHFSKPYFNKQLKELCKQAGITELTQTIKYQGTQRLIETKPKYELISSHTARRSFITLLIKKGAKAEMIMKITGHKKLTTMQKYVRITENEALEAVRDAWD